MSRVMAIDRVEDTLLWMRLNEGYSGTDRQLAGDLAQRLRSICEEAQDRMNWVPAFMPQYTLHDATHLLRVTELMARIIPENVLASLNPVEVFLLILAAHFHDQGMVLDSDEAQGLEDQPEFKSFKENWLVEHPNQIELRSRQLDKNLSEEERDHYRKLENELDSAMITEFIRRGHGPRSASYVRRVFGSDRRWDVAGTSVTDLVARLCSSHTADALNLVSENGFRVDESIGSFQVNMVYLGIILRLADILDFDRDRTPDALYRTIHFTSSVSLAEWDKHRSVQGWVISPEALRFSVQCDHPIYQRSILQYMDWIDEELRKAEELIKRFPRGVEERYTLELPFRVDRTRIEPKDQSYKYYDLEFSLSRDEVVKLLMMDQLYGSPWLCVRELLQNSLDALRYRKAVIMRDSGAVWTSGKVEFEHSLDSEGHEVLRCIDNGIGMDEEVIERFLTMVGRSFYRSPEFQRERESFIDAGVDFDPAAQFGIGFMSVFMIGDRIVIRTRRDYGNRGHGKPLVVEINGINGMVVVRSGSEEQLVGTTVEITGRKKPTLFYDYTDTIRLIPMLERYALATEFPISGECSIPEIAGSVEIPTSAAVPRTVMETAEFERIRTVEQSFSEIDKDLRGTIRTSFLINDHEQLVTNNSEASWRTEGRVGNEQWSQLYPSDGRNIEDLRNERGRTCIDGILVAGQPGRDKEPLLLGYSANPISFGLDNFLLDARGSLKPEITPARTPNRSITPWNPPRWQHLQDLGNEARGRLWEQVLDIVDLQRDPAIFWELALIYQMNVTWLRANCLWNSLQIPVLSDGLREEWRKLNSLGSLRHTTTSQIPIWTTVDGARIAAPERIKQWNNSKYGREADELISRLLAAFLMPDLDDSGVIYYVLPPENPDRPPALDSLRSAMTIPVHLQKYGPNLNQLVTAQLPIRTANREHPLVQVALDCQASGERNDLERFARAATFHFSDPEMQPLIGSGIGVNYRMRWLGHAYLSVDWSRFAERLRPPYAMWSESTGRVDVTQLDLERWAATKVGELVEG